MYKKRSETGGLNLARVGAAPDELPMAIQQATRRIPASRDAPFNPEIQRERGLLGQSSAVDHA